MIKFINSVLFLYVIPFFISGCVSYHSDVKGETKVVDSKKDSITIKSSGSYEECMEVKQGQKMIYKFRSSRPVGFNIHYHGADDVHYPVSQIEVTEADGIVDPAKHDFYIKDQEYYCLMWENNNMGRADISYECTVVEK